VKAKGSIVNTTSICNIIWLLKNIVYIALKYNISRLLEAVVKVVNNKEIRVN